MISAGLATVPRGACIAGVAVVCGGFYLAWSYWSNSGNDTSQDAEIDGGADEKNHLKKISNSVENSNLSSKPLSGTIGLLEQKLNKIDEVKLKSKEKLKQKSMREELLLNAIEFTKTEIANTETLTKQLLVSEKQRLAIDVKFSSKTESVPHILSDNSKKGDSSGIKMRRNNTSFKKDVLNRDWEDCVKPQGHREWNLNVDDNQNIKCGDTKLKPSKTSQNNITDSKIDTFSQKTFSANSSVKDGFRAVKINYGNIISDHKSARPARKQGILKKDKNKEKSIKLEVENVLSEILAVVDDGNKVNNDSATKGDRLPTDKEFISFLYVNQAYFMSASFTG